MNKSHKTNNVQMPQVVILAGGLGTRLGETTNKIPKSLIEVDGIPIITRILDWARLQGCNRGLILTGHLGEMFEGYTHEIDLKFVKEKEALGTGGALWNAREHLENEFILLWGDDYHPIDYSKLISKHREENSLLTMTVTESHDSMNLKHEYGKVMDYNKTSPNVDFNGYEAGTSVVKKEVVETYGIEGRWSWEETIYPKLSGEIIAHIDSTKFWDMGTPKRLEILDDFFKERRARRT
jgi:NDP-sugar pyrophosphorylase family protein